MKTLVSIMFRLLGLLPLGLRRSLGRLGGAVFSCLPLRDRKIAALQLKMCFPDPATRPAVRTVFANLGQTVMESINLWPLINSPKNWPDCATLDTYRKCLFERDRAILGLTAHTGNWDFAGSWYIKMGLPLLTIARQANNPVFQGPLSRLRDSYGIRTLWRDDRKALKELMRAFEEKSVITALIDQDTNVRSTYSRFFGRPARTPDTLIDLALRHNARIFTSFNARVNGRMLVALEAIPDGLNTQEILDEYSRRLEAWIRKYPDQWVWLHKRWRTPPDGERMSSKKYLEWLRQEVEQGKHA